MSERISPPNSHKVWIARAWFVTRFTLTALVLSGCRAAASEPPPFTSSMQPVKGANSGHGKYNIHLQAEALADNFTLADHQREGSVEFTFVATHALDRYLRVAGRLGRISDQDELTSFARLVPAGRLQDGQEHGLEVDWYDNRMNGLGIDGDFSGITARDRSNGRDFFSRNPNPRTVPLLNHSR